MRSSRVISAALTIAAISILAIGLKAADKPDGSELYKERCSMCHGPDGKGMSALKTPDFTDPKWQQSMTDDQIIDTIKNGKKDTPMPPFADKLSADEITAVKDYIRSLAPK
jgi:cytochrome c oxidase cbb3-type subunit III